MTDSKDDLGDKVMKFKALELPGQPMMMHMGTSHLVDELWREVLRLRRKIEAISQVAGKASIEGVTFAQIKGRDSDVLGKYTGPLLDSMSQTAETLYAKALNDGE